MEIVEKKYESIVFSFIMSFIMSGFMSFVITFINLGFVDNFIYIWINAYWKAFLIAFPTILFILPYVKKTVALFVKQT